MYKFFFVIISWYLLPLVLQLQLLVFRIVLSLNSFLLLYTPAPGAIPVSASCIELLILPILFDAKLSIAIINFGFTLSTIPFNTSQVSIPVVPSTPGAIAATDLVSGCKYCGA